MKFIRLIAEKGKGGFARRLRFDAQMNECEKETSDLADKEFHNV
jgi:hypothetical protein